MLGKYPDRALPALFFLFPLLTGAPDQASGMRLRPAGSHVGARRGAAGIRSGLLCAIGGAALRSEMWLSLNHAPHPPIGAAAWVASAADCTAPSGHYVSAQTRVMSLACMSPSAGCAILAGGVAPWRARWRAPEPCARRPWGGASRCRLSALRWLDRVPDRAGQRGHVRAVAVVRPGAGTASVTGREATPKRTRRRIEPTRARGAYPCPTMATPQPNLVPPA